MLDKFRDDSGAFFRGNDDHEAYIDMVNSGLLIMARAYHANNGYETPDTDDMEAVSTVLNWLVRQDADQATEGAYKAKAADVADQLVAKGGLSTEERQGFLNFAAVCYHNTHGADLDAEDSPTQG